LELVELRGYFRKWSNPEPICSQQGGGYLSDDEISIKSGISVQSNQVNIDSPLILLLKDSSGSASAFQLVT
jgi:hypothetical protein